MGIARLRRGSLVLLGGAALLGCGLFAGPDIALPIANLDLEPKPGHVEVPMIEPQGPPVVIASGEVSGEAFTLTVYPTEGGLCMSLAAPTHRGGGCGPGPGDGLPEFERFGMISQADVESGISEVDGLVDPDVATVWVVTGDGQRANAVLIPLDIDGMGAAVFLVFLPEGAHAVAVVAADASGQVLEEFPLLSAPGAAPAPSG